MGDCAHDRVLHQTIMNLGIATTEPALTNEQARDHYLKRWCRIRELELQRLKLDNDLLREQMLLLSFEVKNARQSQIVNRKS